MSDVRSAWGHGLATITLPEILGTDEPQVLDAWFPELSLGRPDSHSAPTGYDATDNLALVPTR
ncbi:MAG: hypothetical protein LBB54_07320, partial [Cellulomonadaceae bacterium]|nr:hypothetical protein [Cellulomonadaceae bacterium]